MRRIVEHWSASGLGTGALVALALGALVPTGCSEPGCPDNKVLIGQHCITRVRLPDGGFEPAAEEDERDAKVPTRDAAKSPDAATDEDGSVANDSGAPADSATEQEPDASGPSSEVDAGPECVPSAETCNAKDDDCDGVVDDGTLTRCWADADGDGYAPAGANVIESCDACGAKSTAVEPVEGKIDCDDASATRNPGATDVCGDNVDNDCNGVPDDAMNNICGGPCTTQLQGKPGDVCKNNQNGACARSGTYECQSDHSLKCSAPMVQPAASEVCGDGSDNDCNGKTDAADGCVANGCGGWTALANPVGKACSVSMNACSYPGTYQCSPTNPELTVCGGTPPKEDCATPTDDNCDGTANEGCVATVASIAAGFAASCAVLSDGTARCWGGNDCGQLGDGSKENRSRPVPVAGLVNASQISLGAHHACALLRDGTVQCWGCNEVGQLGNNSTFASLTPVRVQDLSQVVQLSAGEDKTCAVSSTGEMKCWGNLGSNSPLALVPKPFATSAVETSIGVANSGGCFRVASGGVACWYDNMAAAYVKDVAGAVSLSTGGLLACAVVSGGQVRCWNQGGSADSLAITEAPTITGAATVSAGSDYACAKLTSGGVRCWGSNYYGNLGTGMNGTSGVVAGLDVTALVVGGVHACALTKAGAVSCWGFNPLGQIGDGTSGTTSSRWSPVVVTGLP